jgi:hypothetical protein
MNNDTSTIKKCSTKGCDRPGTRHANHEHASWYCDEHGVCGNKDCGLSVEYFVRIVDQGTTKNGFVWTLDTWMCPCTAKGRHPEEEQRPVYVPEAVVELPKKTVVNYWSLSA